MLIRTGCAALATLCICTGAAAQRFDFGQIPGVPEHPKVEVDIDADLLDFVAAVAERQEPSVAGIIDGLDHVRVLVYDKFEDQATVSRFVDDTSAVLEREGWERTVYVQEQGDEKVRMYTQVDGQRLAGLTVLVLDPTEAIFINITGPIEPAELGRVADAMGFGDFLGTPAPEHTGHGEKQ